MEPSARRKLRAFGSSRQLALDLLDAAPGLAPCFIVHYACDRGFASVLHDELQARGVTCWLSPSGRGTPAARAGRDRGVKVVLCVRLELLVGAIELVDQQHAFGGGSGVLGA